VLHRQRRLDHVPEGSRGYEGETNMVDYPAEGDLEEGTVVPFPSSSSSSLSLYSFLFGS